ncbi:gliding motility-associated C-terminal domain-containing protein [Taibaiella koreensis]|uniref:gliding motility-associated C-terminal domain-containing protein n=1 Tax=Taibaiella koreensis TaxID=1268548 RepID=UPI0013C305B6|nr:gliding motility-associated C-terminal domain-containing protein [Taibaiella koreensis]
MIAKAQNENNIWCFGNNTGLNFNNTPPTLFQNNLAVLEGCASVADAAGNLLFYTSGAIVYDRLGNVMPNGTGLMGNGPSSGPISVSSKEGVAIVPHPQNPNQYYLFCTAAIEDGAPYNLYYSIIDMSLNGGLGDVDVTHKNFILTSASDEAITIVRHASCHSFWLLNMSNNTNSKTLRAFAITPAGIAPAPVITALPYGIANNAIVATRNDSLLLFTGTQIFTASFNKANGQLSNIQSFYTQASTPDVLEFSADGSKLYGCGVNTGLIQFDFGLWPGLPAVAASETTIYSSNVPLMGMRIGPDHKIYVRPVYTNLIGVVNNPNAAGAGCNFVASALSLPAYANPPGYPIPAFTEFPHAFLPLLPPDTFPGHIKDTTLCLETPALLQSDTGYTHYLWNTLDTTPSITTGMAGTYWVKRSKDCSLYIDSFYLHAVTTDTLPVSAKDTSLCGAGPLTLSPAGSYSSYLWNTGDTSATLNVSLSGHYRRYAMAPCKVYVDSFTVQFNPSDTSYHYTDSTLCFAASVTLQPGNDLSHFLWNNSSTGPALTASQDGLYWRRSYDACRLHVDSFDLHFISFTLDLGNDTLLCPGDTLLLQAPAITGATYRWQDGSSDTRYTVSRQGWYAVTASVKQCSLTDSIRVTYRERPSLAIRQPDTTICRGSSLLLETIATGEGSYLWNDGSTEATLPVNAPGTYTVQYINPCISLYDSVTIDDVDCHCIPFVPNAFSPNGDGNNDQFRIRLACPLLLFQLHIFNRFGQELFVTTSPDQGWDGTQNGHPVDLGTYFYYLKYTAPDGTSHKQKGDLTLLR